jgi:hypothetical protein
MSKRTDLAAPSVIDPAAFSIVAGVYFGSNANEDFDAMLGDWASEQGLNEDGKAGWYSEKPAVLEQFPPLDANGNFVRKGTCDHCGARFDWGSVYRHTSGLHIVVGNVCAEKTLSVPSRFELDVKRLKARIAAARETARNAAKAQREAAVDGYEWLYAEKHANPTLADIAAKGLKYGGLTPRQVELIQRIHSGVKPQWQVEKEQREAVRAAQEAAAEPVPTTDERLTIRGEVVCVRNQEGYMGRVTTKMLVRVDAGYKLWGTVPSSLYDADVGAIVEFQAAIERSDKDDKFGFFSRPTKARMVTA